MADTLSINPPGRPPVSEHCFTTWTPFGDDPRERFLQVLRDHLAGLAFRWNRPDAKQGLTTLSPEFDIMIHREFDDDLLDAVRNTFYFIARRFPSDAVRIMLFARFVEPLRPDDTAEGRFDTSSIPFMHENVSSQQKLFV